jgi:DNA-binding transcriptional regulator YdaS (Cro superfamily)
MKLKAYLSANEVTQAEFARRMTRTGYRCSAGLVSQWVNGTTAITAARAVQIEEVTSLEVSREESRPDLFNCARAAVV